MTRRATRARREADEHRPSRNGAVPRAAGGTDWTDEELLLAVATGSPLALYVVDPDGVVELWNPAAERLFGWSADEAIGRRLPFVAHESEAEFDALRSLALSGQSFSGVETTRRRKDGTAVDLSISTVPLRDAQGIVRAVLGVSQDITERKAAQAALLRQARVDSLTGLYARGYFLEILERELHEGSSSSALVLLDLDDFKKVNDSYGHNVGDELLAGFAHRLVAAVGDSGEPGRLGGDEFVVLLRQVDPTTLDEATERLLDGIRSPLRAGGRQFDLGVSAGVTHMRRGTRVQEVLRRADLALFEAKRSRPGTICQFDEAMERVAVERMLLESQLPQAIERGELFLHYQPIIHLESGKMTGVEALVRWQHPDLGPLAPARFVPLAESTGAIVALGLHVLRESCTQLRHWQDKYPAARELTLSVNLSPRQMREPDLAAQVSGILSATGVQPARLQLEVTEHMLASHDEERGALQSLGALGVQLAIDDFGTGYASLMALRRFPFSSLKIDKSFVAGLTSGWEDRAIVVATLSLSKSLGLEVIAEGVETHDQLAMLRELGCASAQGFLLGRPGPASSIAERLDAG